MSYKVRLSSLANLSIESHCLDDVFIDMTIETFADNNAHNKSF